MYLAAISWGLSPSEFWGMTIPEWFLLEDFHSGRTAKKAEAEKRLADLKLTRDEWWAKYGNSVDRS